MAPITSDHKCIYHINQDITFICIQCNQEPVCNECITSEEYHQCHKIKLIDFENTKLIYTDFIDNILPNLKSNKIQSNTTILNKSKSTFKLISDNYQTNINKVKNEFKEFHSLLTTIETKLLNELNSNNELNQKLSKSIESKIEDDINQINQIIDKYNTNINNNNKNNNHTTTSQPPPLNITINKNTSTKSQINSQSLLDIKQVFDNNKHKEIIKHYQQSKFLSKNNNDKINEYKHIHLITDSKTSNLIKDSIKSVLSISNSSDNKGNSSTSTCSRKNKNNIYYDERITQYDFFF